MRVVLRLGSTPLLAVAIACSISGPGEERDPLVRLAEARQAWEASGITDYEFLMRRNCGECLPSSALAVVVSVSPGRKTVSRADNGTVVEASPGLYPDVEGLFELIEEMVLAGAKVDVDYDRERGFPRSVSIDPVPDAIDDEFGYVVEDLRVGRHAELRAALAMERERWTATRIGSYQLTLRRTCFCVPGAAGTVLVNVFDQEPSEWHYFLTGEPVQPELQRFFPGVDGLFDFIAEAIDRGADSIEVTFDPELGLPQEILVDFRLAAADEEVAYRVEKIVPVDDGVEPAALREGAR